MAWFESYIDDPAFEQWLEEQFGRTSPGANQDDLAAEIDAERLYEQHTAAGNAPPQTDLF